MTAILDAFGRIRMAAEGVMDKQDLAGYDWSEPTVTDMCIIAGEPEVRHAKFNQTEEGVGVGADYLWWWLDPVGGECFGMLVQAKALRRTASGWRLDISHGKGKQLADLMATADRFGVPAMYGVYTGGQVGRGTALHALHADADAYPGDVVDHCDRCRRITVSMIAALQLSHFVLSPKTTTSLFMAGHVALEDLADPDLTTGVVLDRNLRKIESEPLRTWLVDDQNSAREVAKKIFKGVSEVRSGMLSEASAVPTLVAGEPVFDQIPEDTGHWTVSYYDHILRGLRTAPPMYISSFLAGQPLPADVTDAVDGIVVVQL